MLSFPILGKVCIFISDPIELCEVFLEDGKLLIELLFELPSCLEILLPLLYLVSSSSLSDNLPTKENLLSVKLSEGLCNCSENFLVMKSVKSGLVCDESFLVELRLLVEGLVERWSCPDNFLAAY